MDVLGVSLSSVSSVSVSGLVSPVSIAVSLVLVSPVSSVSVEPVSSTGEGSLMVSVLDSVHFCK